MNIAGQRRPACVTRLNCEFRGALVTVNRRWPPSVCFLQHTSTRQGSGTAHPAARLARRWDRDPQVRFNGGQCRRRRRPICRGHRGGFRSCVRATVEKAAWCSRSPTARCTTRPPCFLSETFFGYSPIGSRSAAHPRTLEASLIVRWAGTHSAMSPSCSPFRPLAVQSRCAVEENLWAKRDAVVILLGRAFPSAGAQEARS